jgi:hypothetical protein
MNSDGDKLYMKLVAFDEILQLFSSNFSHLKSSWGLKMIYCPDLNFRYPDLDIISFLALR